jgi:membrane protein YqaA with SNARE-associated domain
MVWETAAALAGLFAAAFGAATLVPLQSELVLAAMQAKGVATPGALFVVATAGNTLGSLVNYAMGLFVDRFEGRRWFPASAAQMARARRWYARWGIWTLLLSWAPFADPLTLVAGVLRTPLAWFLTLVLVAKAGRYAAVMWLCDAANGCAGA